MDEEKDLTPQDSEEEFVEEKNKNGKLVLIFIVCFVIPRSLLPPG